MYIHTFISFLFRLPSDFFDASISNDKREVDTKPNETQSSSSSSSVLPPGNNNNNHNGHTITLTS